MWVSVSGPLSWDFDCTNLINISLKNLNTFNLFTMTWSSVKEKYKLFGKLVKLSELKICKSGWCWLINAWKFLSSQIFFRSWVSVSSVQVSFSDFWQSIYFVFWIKVSVSSVILMKITDLWRLNQITVLWILKQTAGITVRSLTKWIVGVFALCTVYYVLYPNNDRN